ncbi:hypothetical protein Ancab_036695 [Ancistrocladus abbreviatus]
MAGMDGRRHQSNKLRWECGGSKEVRVQEEISDVNLFKHMDAPVHYKGDEETTSTKDAYHRGDKEEINLTGDEYNSIGKKMYVRHDSSMKGGTTSLSAVNEMPVTTTNKNRHEHRAANSSNGADVRTVPINKSDGGSDPLTKSVSEQPDKAKISSGTQNSVIRGMQKADAVKSYHKFLNKEVRPQPTLKGIGLNGLQGLGFVGENGQDKGKSFMGHSLTLTNFLQRDSRAGPDEDIVCGSDKKTAYLDESSL